MIKWRVWLRGANASIYSCHFLAAWSGRMWVFSLSLFLISVSPKSLRLSGTYGLSMGAAVLVFGTVIGDWVDRTPRLKAATVSMICQNVLIATCACVVLALLLLLSETAGIADWLRHLLYAIIISLSVSSRLMKESRVIVVERDWIVEMCAKDEHQLAIMSSSLRRIDLVTKILAPIVTGQIMTFAGPKVGCGFIAVWSLISLGVEYYLLRRVYNLMPALKRAKYETRYAAVYKEKELSISDKDQCLEKNNKSVEATEYNETDEAVHIRTSHTSSRETCNILRQFLSSFLILYRGPKTYLGCVTKWPGMALACLFLTVLTMGDITVGYGTIQGLSGSILGILTGVGASFGILSTLTYPFIVKRLGLPMTGVLALGLQVSCLTLCVISVWLPGSPFDLSFSYKIQERNESLRNCSIEPFDAPDLVKTLRIDQFNNAWSNIALTTLTPIANLRFEVSTSCILVGPRNDYRVFGFLEEVLDGKKLSLDYEVQENSEHNGTHDISGGAKISVMSDFMSNMTSCEDDASHPVRDASLSVWVMIAGIMLSRFGLWTGHLAIVQIFLENVAVGDRGIVNGFQASLNQLMNFLKYGLVVILPNPHQFGLLVFISYCSICTAWMFMGVNAVQTRRRNRTDNTDELNGTEVQYNDSTLTSCAL